MASQPPPPQGYPPQPAQSPPAYATQPQMMLQPPQPHAAAAASAMPPPTAPASRPTDPTDLADALTSAGIDLKAEEAQLSATGATNGYSNGWNGYASAQFATSEEAAQRAEAQARAYHLNNPFLSLGNLGEKLYNTTAKENLKTKFSLAAQGGGIKMAGPEADIAALISLAAAERLKGLVTRSIALAKRRRTGTIVPLEWAGHIMGATPEASSAISPKGVGKRSFDSAQDPSPAESASYPRLPPNETTKALLELKRREYEADQARLQKRQRRETAEVSKSAPPAAAPATPDGIAGDPSTPGPSERKMSAKEARKVHNTAMSEAQSHRNANATANLMMGGGGFGSKKKKKTYAWMNAAPNASAGPAGQPGAPAVGGGPAGGMGTAGVNGSQGLEWVGQKFGRWKEDGEKERPVQIRDWVTALSEDGRVEKKTIAKAYMRLK